MEIEERKKVFNLRFVLFQTNASVKSHGLLKIVKNQKNFHLFNELAESITLRAINYMFSLLR